MADCASGVLSGLTKSGGIKGIFKPRCYPGAAYVGKERFGGEKVTFGFNGFGHGVRYCFSVQPKSYHLLWQLKESPSSSVMTGIFKTSGTLRQTNNNTTINVSTVHR